MDLSEINEANPHRHPWELSRAASLLRIVADLAPLTSVADIGAGDLFFAKQLHPNYCKELFAVDAHFNSLEDDSGIHKRKDISEINSERLDLVLLMDVLEHVADDLGFLQTALSRLRPGGRVLITVPAHPFLFSDHDRKLKHFRRYRAKDLARLLTQTDVKVEEFFAFYTPLLGVRALGKVLEGLRLKSKESHVSRWRFDRQSPLTRSIEVTLNLDFHVNRFVSSLGLPTVGLSLCALATKQ